MDDRTFPLFGRTYGRKLSSFSFSGLITDKNYMFLVHRCGRKFFDFLKYFIYSLLCLLRNHWNIKENIFVCMANLGFFGRNYKRKVIVAFLLSAVPPKTKKNNENFLPNEKWPFFRPSLIKIFCKLFSKWYYSTRVLRKLFSKEYQRKQDLF